MPAFTATTQSGGANAILNLNRILGLPSNQNLTAAFGLDDTASTFSQNPTNGGAAVSGHANTLNPSLAVNYRLNDNYIIGTAAFSAGRVWESSAAGSGAFNTQGYSFDGAFGHIFPLWNGLTLDNFLRNGWTIKDHWWSVMLDVDGHVGYANQTSSTLADSSGFTVDGGRAYFTVAGVSARLFGLYRYQDAGFVEPYVKFSYDNYFDFSNTAAIPTQGTIPTTQVVFFDNPHNVERFETGVSFRANNGIRLTASGYYAMFDGGTNFGGSLSLKIPFDMPIGTPQQQALAAPPIITKTH